MCASGCAWGSYAHGADICRREERIGWGSLCPVVHVYKEPGDGFKKSNHRPATTTLISRRRGETENKEEKASQGQERACRGGGARGEGALGWRPRRPPSKNHICNRSAGESGLRQGKQPHSRAKALLFHENKNDGRGREGGRPPLCAYITPTIGARRVASSLSLSLSRIDGPPPPKQALAPARKKSVQPQIIFRSPALPPPSKPARML